MVHTASCPSCGAPITFRWSQAVQTTCSSCSSILVRHDLDLEKVGRVSAPPPRTSRIQIGTEGRHDGRSFTVVGRIAYRWGRGGWSEWHIVFADGTTAWLSDAQDEYAITRLVAPPKHIPAADAIRPGFELRVDARRFEVTTVTPARYAGVEGELPFEYWDHDEVVFADLRSAESGLATIDYSEDEPLLFVGDSVDFAALGLRNLLDPPEREVREVRTLGCPSCGGAVSILRPEDTVTVVCRYCGSVLDAASPGLEVIQKLDRRKLPDPRIPLGSTGKLRGAEYTVLGFQERTIRVEGENYSWREYLLHAPEQGFRYLSEYDGHWNYITPLKALPEVAGRRIGQNVAILYGEKFKEFQKASARTTAVLGEFPWEIRVGDEVQAIDYVSPPRMLSCERTRQETSWSLGEYTKPARIWEAFGLEGRPPRPKGVFANQPSWGRTNVRAMIRVFPLAAALLAAVFVVRAALGGQTVASAPHQSLAAQPDSSIVVLGPFELGGRTSNVQIKTEAAVDNTWIYFDFDLVNVETGERRTIGREISYYHGVDGGERWSEGDHDDAALLSRVPPGQYALRIYPQSERNVSYTVTVRRDVAPGRLYLLALGVMLLPALVVGFSAYKFEVARWAESDHPLVTED